ncbi:MAG: Phenylalanine-tRNA ligase beta subunit [Parcubacteria group bacterium GW2011_GWA2_47_8b]|nr:MAG: Phenylalanine-tRNA ligase beta subunit [Parcubacteria group bacterium GW2011_GWA2_47_8b]
MKFSYTLLKQLVPRLPDKAGFIEKFNLHAFEAEDTGGDTLEISIPANRYSDASSHWGIAKIAAAIFNASVKYFGKEPKTELKNKKPAIKILAKKECRSYSGRYFEISRIGDSPEWMKVILRSCGLRPINAVVDVMNYVMLETGQPLHAFDANLVAGEIGVRLAKRGEEIATIDGGNYRLDGSDLVIADEKGPLAIAGVKGGKRAEVSPATRKIIVEAANFDSPGIYKTSRRLNLFTDASARFSHGLSLALVDFGMRRATELLKEICKIKVGEVTSAGSVKEPKRILKFDINKFNLLAGLELKDGVAMDYLKRLGFKVTGSAGRRLVEVPPERTDISIFEDLAEEIINLYGYEQLPANPPRVPLVPVHSEEGVLLKEKVREIMRGFGLSEVYNYSFVSRKQLVEYAEPKWWGAVSLLNPISADFQYLRPSLTLHLMRNIKEQENPIFELKGVINELLQQLGLTEYFLRDLDWDLRFLDQDNSLRIESDHQVLGYVGLPKNSGTMAIAEIFLDKLFRLVEEEKEYEPVPKYPSIMRDISLLVPTDLRVNRILEEMQRAAPKFLDDVDLVDFYEDTNLKEGRKSLTFRLVFQADDRTLTDEEVGQEMEKIIAALTEQFEVEVR